MYVFSTRLPGPPSKIESKLIDALAQQGFGIISEIDVQATLKKKMDIDRPPYKILGACNPGLANQAIEADADVGALLPCNIVMRAEGDDCVISFMDPLVVLGLSPAAACAELGQQVRTLLLKVRDALGGEYQD